MLRSTGLYARSLFQKFNTRPYSSRRPFSFSYNAKFPRLNNSVNGARSGSSSSTVIDAGNVSFAAKVGRPSIRNQIIFVLLGSGAAYTYASLTTDLETNLLLKKVKEQSTGFTFMSITNRDLTRVQNMELVKKLRLRFAEWNAMIVDLPPFIRQRLSMLYLAIFQPYADASQGRRLCWKICLLNLGVWFMWKIRQPMMLRSFAHNPLSGASFTLLTSMFSHQGFLHLALNCLALESFGSAAYVYLNNSVSQEAPEKLESTSVYHWLAFYVSAGMFSSLVSHIASVTFKYPRLIAQLSSPVSNVPKTADTWAAAVAASSSTANSSRSLFSSLTKSSTSSSTVAAAAAPKPTLIPPSLGASGAVYACVTMTALAFPQAQVSLIFPPSYPLDIQTAVVGLVALDMIGIMRGWKMIDHWAHLGGAAFGAAYYAYGPKLWAHLRNETQPR
ncbi:hypothetical protein E1B28_007181 [Marasmius oreades]|uniref:Peptidase S54 rhomboid domain-containing protein n=1 Tax=Marasmius oreades TaxID=181124 RepID=A0A9P7S152_9AGAR|nr:uncharacterized protein E1B28_007181 [Marasmius oreades]KAG7093506.1 hypothetical protein E1B28_007181 [Marasmius oreades]